MERCNCDKQESLNLYIDGQLTEDEESILLEHVETCAICRDELADLQFVKNTLENLPELELPEGFHDELMSKLNAQRHSAAKKIMRVDFRRMASAAAGIFLTFTLMSVILTAISAIVPDSQASTGVQLAAVAEQSAMNAGSIAGEGSNINSFSNDVGSESIQFYGDANSSLQESKMEPFSVGEIALDYLESDVAMPGTFTAAGNTNPDSHSGTAVSAFNRRHYTINIETTDISGALSIINALSGTNISSSSWEYGMSKNIEITRLVPAEGFDYCLTLLRSIGRVTFEEETRVSTDSTVYDLESRIKAKRAEEERLMLVLQASRDLETLSEVSARLGIITDEVESYESELRTYKQNSTMPSININISNANDIIVADISFTQKLSERFSHTLGSTTKYMEDFLVWLAFVSIPLALLSIIALLIYAVRKRRTERC